MVIDGIDGRVHYLELDAGLLPEEARLGAIVTVGREPSVRSVDKTIAALAARNHGFYEPRQHAEIAKVTQRIPSGDVEGHVEAHVRRLAPPSHTSRTGHQAADVMCQFLSFEPMPITLEVD